MAEVSRGPFLLVLGTAQDGGVPQAGCRRPCCHAAWTDPARRRRVACVAAVDPHAGAAWLIDATPDFREQLRDLQAALEDPPPRAARVPGGDSTAEAAGRPGGNDLESPAGNGEPRGPRPGVRGESRRRTPAGLAGIFLTHGHIGHYLGLSQLGREVMATERLPVFAAPGMTEFLRRSAPWDQLVRLRQIELRPLEVGTTVDLTPRLSVTPFLVPHRNEYTETCGFLVTGPSRRAAYVPDIDGWGEGAEAASARPSPGRPSDLPPDPPPSLRAASGRSVSLGPLLDGVDAAWIDGTFWDDREIPFRDPGEIPHPRIVDTLALLSGRDAGSRAKVRFTHLNHTNPVLDPSSAEARRVAAGGGRVAREQERFDL